MKCEGFVDKGPTRIRGWHDYKSCSHVAKFKVTYTNGKVKNLCGVHKNAELKKYGDYYIEKVEPLTVDQ